MIEIRARHAYRPTRRLRCAFPATAISLIAVVGLLAATPTNASTGAPTATFPAQAGAGTGAPPEHACRLWGMIGTAPDDAVLDDQLVSGTHSLMTLASSNRDGWGVAYWATGLSGIDLGRPQVLRGGPPANDPNDPRYRLAAAEIGQQDAHCAVVHVRAASSGHANAPDPHPFVRGNLCLAHNGSAVIATMQALLEEGTPGYLEKHPPDYDTPYVDSELYFLYVLKRLELGDPSGEGPRPACVSHAIRDAALRMYDAGAATTSINCVVASDDTLYALRFDTSDQTRYKLRYKKIPGAWVVASEPVGTDTTGWSSVPPKSLAIFTPLDPPRILTVFPPASAWLALEEVKVDDDPLGQSQGNGDGVLNAGEIVELNIRLQNVGGTTATQILGVLCAADAFCTVLDSSNAYPDLQPEQSSLPVSPFVVHVSPTAPAFFNASFSLRVMAEIGPADGRVPALWTRTFTLPGRSASLACPFTIAADLGGGNLEPGEDGTLLIALENRGAAGATSLVGQAEATSPYLEILQPLAGIDTLAIGEIETLAPPYEVRVSPEAPNPEILTGDLHVTADWGLTTRIPFEIPVGGFVDPFEGGPGEWSHTSGLGGYGDAWHLSTMRNHTPGGSTSWKCGSPDSGATYPNLLDAILESPVVPLARRTQLCFWHFLQAELDFGHFGKACDGGIVEASINGGPWTQIYPATGYDFIIGASSPPGPFPPQTPVFSGWWLWRESVFEIEGFTGTIQFRFRFGSDGENLAETLEGWYIDDVRVLGTNSASGVETEIAVPLRPALTVGGPSPFRDQTLILYDVARGGDIELSILDLEGRVVRRLVRGPRSMGRHRLVWDGRDHAGHPVPAGLYFYRLESRAEAFEEVRRVIRVR